MPLEEEIKAMKREMASIKDLLERSKQELDSEREARLKAETELRDSLMMRVEGNFNALAHQAANSAASLKQTSEDAQNAISRALANAKDAIHTTLRHVLDDVRQAKENTLNEISRATSFAKTDVEGSTGHLSKRMMKEVHKILGDKVEGARKGLKKEARRLAESIRDARKVRETLENVAKRAKHAGGRLRGALGGLLDNIADKVDHFDRWTGRD